MTVDTVGKLRRTIQAGSKPVPASCFDGDDDNNDFARIATNTLHATI